MSTLATAGRSGKFSPIEGARGLHATTPQTLSFAPSHEIRAFVIERPQGNVLIYSTGRLEDDADSIVALGGIERQYLNHWHEAMFGLAPGSLGARLIHHRADAGKVAEHGGAGASFDRRHAVGDDLEAIPIPGHTAGATAYLWDSPQGRLLFTGDSLMLDGEEWIAAVLESSDRDSYVESLRLLRSIEFDVLVPWAASVGGPLLARVDGSERLRKLDRVIERVAAGARA